jgi:hypothetical protein
VTEKRCDSGLGHLEGKPVQRFTILLPSTFLGAVDLELKYIRNKIAGKKSGG